MSSVALGRIELLGIEHESHSTQLELAGVFVLVFTQLLRHALLNQELVDSLRAKLLLLCVEVCNCHLFRHNFLRRG